MWSVYSLADPYILKFILFQSEKNVPQSSTSSFGGSGNTQLVFSSSFTNAQPPIAKSFNAPSNQMFKASLNFLQVPSENQDNKNISPAPGIHETHNLNFTVHQNLQAQQARAKIEAEKKAAELEKHINTCSEIHMQDLLDSSVKEATTEIALLEWKAAEEQQQAEEEQRALEQLRAEEELRIRALVNKFSNESLCDLFNDVVKQIVAQCAQEVLYAEMELAASIDALSQEWLKSLINDVSAELCNSVAIEEKRRANESARYLFGYFSCYRTSLHLSM